MNLLDTAELKTILEALLFAAPGPVRLEQLALAAEVDPGQVAPLLAELDEEYRCSVRGFVLVALAEGYQLRTRPEHAEMVRRLQAVVRCGCPALLWKLLPSSPIVSL